MKKISTLFILFSILSSTIGSFPVTVSADSGFPSGTITSTYDSSTKTLSISGSYTGAVVSSSKRPGFAIFINDNNPSTESLDSEVHLVPLTSGNDSSGVFSDSHNLENAPTKVCVVIYDVHLKNDEIKSGELNPAGSSRNGDNSWDKSNKNTGKTAMSYADESCSNVTVTNSNHAPVITLVGSNPVKITVGLTYSDSGATALDQEDGDITSNITTTSNVNTNLVGSYTVTYNVSDSKGLAAVPVSRVVDVVPRDTSVIIATKIVCSSESDLPNWGEGSGPDIASTTATNFLLTHPNCSLQSGWGFEWAPDGTPNPGDNILTPAGGSWTSFEALTNTASGTAQAIVPSGSRVWVREIMKDGYISYTGASSTDSVTAEMYCDTDHLYYDNYDFVESPVTGKTYHCVAFNANKPVVDTNHKPVITLVGVNPVSITVGSTYSDSGATALDQEDGDITSNIATTSNVNTNLVGSYTVTYNVSDSKGLAAVPVSRTVNVLENSNGGSNKGQITFCLVVADSENKIATTSSGLPTGMFTMSLATSTNIGSTTLQTKVWNSSSLLPNSKVVTTEKDADCVTYSNLDLGTYYYSTTSVSGALWNTPKYNDKYNQTINNVFDFYNFTPQLFNSDVSDDSLRDLNADGHIILDSFNKDRSVNVLVTYNPTPVCTTNCGGGSSPVSNLAVTKTVDKKTASAGDSLVYTITVTNNGPYNASGVSLTESISSLFNVTSINATSGAFSTSTNMWVIGDLLNGSSTTLILSGNIKSGSEGQKVTNSVNVTASQNDNDTSNNSVSVDTNVNPVVPAPCTTNCGGGGGNGPVVGSYGVSNGPIVGAVVPQVAGASTTSCYYLYDYLRKDFKNNPVEVKKLQVFLRDLEGHTALSITGVYDDSTIEALNSFQNKYKDDILTPWGHTSPTSYTYILTKKKVNEIYCKTAFPVTVQQQEEIDNYRNFLNSLKKEGISVNPIVISKNTQSTTTVNTVTTTKDTVVNKDTKNSNDLTTLAGVSSTTQKIADDMTANVISAGKKLASGILGFVMWPFKYLADKIFVKNSQCVPGISFVSFILIIIILIVSYLWYREYKNNKLIDDINKQIDLN